VVGANVILKGIFPKQAISEEIHKLVRGSLGKTIDIIKKIVDLLHKFIIPLHKYCF